MSFLQEYFVHPQEFEINEWANYGSTDYLKYKYQLLQRGVKYDEFDYGKGLAFSSVLGEKLAHQFQVSEGKYILAVREYEEDGFEWKLEERTSERGVISFERQSGDDMSIVNVVALVPIADYELAQKQTEAYLNYFEVINEAPELAMKGVKYKSDVSYRYELTFGERVNWVILSESYSGRWVLTRDQLSYEALPAYSMVNIFYKRPEWDDRVELYFTGQDEIRWGAYWSLLVGLGTTVFLLWYFLQKNDERKH